MSTIRIGNKAGRAGLAQGPRGSRTVLGLHPCSSGNYLLRGWDSARAPFPHPLAAPSNTTRRIAYMGGYTFTTRALVSFLIVTSPFLCYLMNSKQKFLNKIGLRLLYRNQKLCWLQKIEPITERVEKYCHFNWQQKVLVVAILVRFFCSEIR